MFCADTSLLPDGLSAATFLDWIQESVDAWNATAADVEIGFSGICATPWADGNRRNEIAFTVFDPTDSAVGYALTTQFGSTVVEADVNLSVDWDAPVDTCWRHVMVHELATSWGSHTA